MVSTVLKAETLPAGASNSTRIINTNKARAEPGNHCERAFIVETPLYAFEYI
jgi:hypothetical protein